MNRFEGMSKDISFCLLIAVPSDYLIILLFQGNIK